MRSVRDVQHWLAQLGHRPGFEDELVAFPPEFPRPRRLVDPARISRGLNHRLWSKEERARLLVGGHWRTKRRAIVSRTVRQIFDEGLPYTGSDQFRRMVEVVESGKEVWSYGCETVEDVHEYFRALVASYESMRIHGYLSQEELGGNPDDEIKVYLAASGELLIGDGGNHRLAMARLLGIGEVYAVVAGVHLRWARRCFDQWGPPLSDAIYHGLDALPGVRRERPRERRERRARIRARAEGAEQTASR